jgi:hypothetical protein
MELKLAVGTLLLMNPSKGQTEEVISEVVITTAEAVVGETEEITTGRKQKIKNYERYC